MKLILQASVMALLFVYAAAAADDKPEFAVRVVERARLEALNHVDYDASFYHLPYPGGDLPADVGCCTDLVIRAYRNAGIDLQKEIVEDYNKRPEGYPLASRDELTHRRCRHLVVWFRRYADERSAKTDEESLKDYKPGDVVFFNFSKYSANFPEHVGIVSERPFLNGMPFIYDNLGPEAAERPLNSFPVIHSRFRWPEKNAGTPIEPRYAAPKKKTNPIPEILKTSGEENESAPLQAVDSL